MKGIYSRDGKTDQIMFRMYQLFSKKQIGAVPGRDL